MLRDPLPPDDRMVTGESVSTKSPRTFFMALFPQRFCELPGTGEHVGWCGAGEERSRLHDAALSHVLCQHPP